MSAPSRVLCLNNGSSSLKLAFYDGETRLASITVEESGSDRGRITTSDNARRILESEAPGTFADTQAALRAAFSALDAAKLHPPDAVGHRVISLPADRAERRRGFPDLIGALLVTLARATITYMPVAGSTAGWISVRFIGGASLAVILLVAFATWELRHGNPLMRLGIFRLPALGAANVVTFLFGAWNAGEVLILALYRQRILGYSPFGAGLASLPQALAGLTAGLIGACLVHRFGTKALLLAMTATSAAAHMLLSKVIGSGDHLLVSAVLFAVGFGTGGTAFAATVAGCGCVADLEQGLAGGLINSSRQIGSALGVAAQMDVATSVSARHVPGRAALATGYTAALVFAAGLAAAAFFVSVAFIPANRPPLPSIGGPLRLLVERRRNGSALTTSH